MSAMIASWAAAASLRPPRGRSANRRRHGGHPRYAAQPGRAYPVLSRWEAAVIDACDKVQSLPQIARTVEVGGKGAAQPCAIDGVIRSLADPPADHGTPGMLPQPDRVAVGRTDSQLTMLRDAPAGRKRVGTREVSVVQDRFSQPYGCYPFTGVKTGLAP
jgi:hypothetical protein